MKLRAISPPPISSTKESATSVITTALRSRWPLPRPVVRPLARNTSMMSGREARSAGMIPKTLAARSAASAVNASTIGSIATSSSRGRFFGAR